MRRGLPEVLASPAVERARRALIAKRRLAAGHLLPRLREALGPGWAEEFGRHAARYMPIGMAHHVDDAWELAVLMRSSPDRRLATAAHDDLVCLRLRFTRHAPGASRIRERRTLLIALLHTPRQIVVRLPGPTARIWSFKIWKLNCHRPVALDRQSR